MTTLDSARRAAPVLPSRGVLRPLTMGDITIDGGFWAHRQQLNQEVMIPHCEHWEERSGWIANFDHAVDATIEHHRTGRQFADSDVYKLLEAMAWEIGRSGDVGLQTRFDGIVRRIAPAQHDDGYLHTLYGNTPGQARRYSDLEWGHELYCVGHLLQAAVARIRTGHPDCLLVQIATRCADRVCEDFGESGLHKVCGHPEIEVGLVEFSRATGNQKYLRQARLFLDRRGQGTLGDIEFGRAYYQDDMPIAKAEVFRGHAVRALYLAAGAIDAGVEEEDFAWVDLIEKQYLRTLATRTYINGGMGSHHQDEAFGEDFELPPDRSYCETCAGIASVMVAWRLLLSTGNLAYGDVIERTLYNVVATSPAATGDAFFYTNPLQQRVPAQAPAADEISPRANASLRAPWFEVSCCPTNVARTFAQLASYVATTSDNAVQLLQFVPGTIQAQLTEGRQVTLRVTTEYPYGGRVGVEVIEAPTDPWTFTTRIPNWAHGSTVDVGDGSGPQEASGASFSYTGSMLKGDRIVIELPVEPRFSYPDPRIDAVRNCVAVEKGPLVYCLESIDIEGAPDVANISVDLAAGLVVGEGDTVTAYGKLNEPSSDVDGWPYVEESVERLGRAVELPLIPYHRWGNRGPSTMRIWLPAQ